MTNKVDTDEASQQEKRISELEKALTDAQEREVIQLERESDARKRESLFTWREKVLLKQITHLQRQNAALIMKKKKRVEKASHNASKKVLKACKANN